MLQCSKLLQVHPLQHTMPNTGSSAIADGSGSKRASSAPRDERSTLSTSNRHLQLGLDDLLGDLRFARRRGDLGRLALLSYCEVRRWARMAGIQELAEHSSEMVTNSPPASREAFLTQIDDLIAELEKTRCVLN